MANLLKIEGIGKTFAGKLAKVGVTTTNGLLEIGATPKGRKGLSDKTGLVVH